MKTRFLLYILAIGVFGWLGCSDDDEKLTPSDLDEYELIIPQGNHDYDTKIVDFYNRTGVYMLYKFTDREVFFNVNNAWRKYYEDTLSITMYYTLGEFYWLEGDVLYNAQGVVAPLGISYKDGLQWEAVLEGNQVTVTNQYLGWNGDYVVNEADEAYVGEQLNLLDDLLLGFYLDSVLRKVMPLKILLSQDLKKRNSGSGARLGDISHVSIFNSLIVSYGNEAIESLTLSQKKTFKADLNFWLLTERMEPFVSHDEFYSVSDYSGLGTSTAPSTAQYYELGFLGSKTGGRLSTPAADLQAYIWIIISTPYEILTVEPASDTYNGTDYTGILHEKKDKKGLIRQKYDLLIREFGKQGVDLQAIGNNVIEN